MKMDIHSSSCAKAAKHWHLLLCLKTEEHLKQSGKPQFVLTRCMASQRQPNFMKMILQKDIFTFITIHRSRPLKGNAWNSELRSCGSSWTDTSEKMKSLVKLIRSTFICITANRGFFWVLMNEPMWLSESCSCADTFASLLLRKWQPLRLWSSIKGGIFRKSFFNLIRHLLVPKANAFSHRKACHLKFL